jgi:hypothetical protein
MAHKTNSNYSIFVKDVLADAGEFTFEVIDSKVTGRLYVITKGDQICTITEKSVLNHKYGTYKETLDWQLDQVDKPGWLKADEWSFESRNGWLVYFNDGFRPYQWFGANTLQFGSIKAAIETVNVIKKKKCHYDIDTDSMVIKVVD